MMKNDSKISALGDILNSMLHDMKVDGGMEHVMLRDIWNQAVGARIAENTRPEFIREGVLFVNVANSVWMQELHFLRDKILEKVNSELDSTQIKEIRFKIGSLPVSARKTSSEQLPSLSKEEIEKVKQQSSAIDDPDLRQSFQALMEAYLKNKKRG
jgi:predicted nucleic acid-binding Zn ribbon protein